MLKSAWNSFINLAVTEPAMLMTALQTALALVVSLGLGLSTDWTGGILALASAVLASIPGFLARPVKVSAITGLVTAAVTAMITFGVHVQPGLAATVNAAIVAIMAIILRQHLTPVATLKAQAKAAAAEDARARM